MGYGEGQGRRKRARSVPVISQHGTFDRFNAAARYSVSIFLFHSRAELRGCLMGEQENNFPLFARPEEVLFCVLGSVMLASLYPLIYLLDLWNVFSVSYLIHNKTQEITF